MTSLKRKPTSDTPAKRSDRPYWRTLSASKWVSSLMNTMIAKREPNCSEVSMADSP